MFEEDVKVTQYLVPANVSARFEFFVGFGWPELFMVACSLIFGIVLFYLLSFLSFIPVFIRLIISALPVLFVFFAVKEEPTSGMSLWKLNRYRKEYGQRQKRYIYRV